MISYNFEKFDNKRMGLEIMIFTKYFIDNYFHELGKVNIGRSSQISYVIWMSLQVGKEEFGKEICSNSL